MRPLNALDTFIGNTGCYHEKECTNNQSLRAPHDRVFAGHIEWLHRYRQTRVVQCQLTCVSARAVFCRNTRGSGILQASDGTPARQISVISNGRMLPDGRFELEQKISQSIPGTAPL
jgi:hypothetical protein